MFKGFMAIWVLWVAIVLTLIGGGIYIGIHFLSRVW